MIKNYFAGGNTSIGFYSLFDEVVKSLDTLYILKGGPGSGKSTFIKEVGELFSNKGYDIDMIHCSLDSQSLDGVIVPSIKLGIIDGSRPHIVDPIYPGVKERIIDFGEFLGMDQIKNKSTQIIKYTDDVIKKSKLAYEQFAEAKLIHDEWEQIYLSAMNFDKANQVTADLINSIFKEKLKRDSKQYTKKIFFGAATPEGYIHYIGNITENIKKRYIIKGRPGSGKSTMMKMIAKHAEKLGLAVEVYPCGFDPNSIDMVLIPSLSVAILDGTAPHVVNPDRENDEVIDMFALCINPEVEVNYESALNNIESRYRIKMTIATNYIKEARSIYYKLKEYYINAMDFSALNYKKSQIVTQLSKYIEVG